MDRKLILYPTASGWRGGCLGGEWSSPSRDAASLGEVATALRGRGKVGALLLAIPSRAVVFERMTLPSVEHAELCGMVRLQFEKSLPHPAEEMGFGWQVLRQNGAETVLMACAVHEPELAALAAPLGEPERSWRVSPWAFLVAAQGSETGASCGVWREGEEIFFGIFQGRRLGFIEAVRDPLVEIPRVLLSAAMAGAPTRFEKLFMDPELTEYAEALSVAVGAPLAPWTADGCGGVLDREAQWMPEMWRVRAERRVASRKWWLRIGGAAAVYAALLVAAAVGLGLEQRRLGALNREVAALHPQVDGLIERQARWNTLAPAADPERFLVELLYQTCQAFPTPETRLTRFEVASQAQLVIEGEAGNARQAIAFAENLKVRPGLSAYRFESGPPVLLSNDHAQFRILAKP